MLRLYPCVGDEGYAKGAGASLKELIYMLRLYPCVGGVGYEEGAGSLSKGAYLYVEAVSMCR